MDQAPPPLPKPQGPRLAVFSSLAAGICAQTLIWVDWAFKDPYLLPSRTGISLLALTTILCAVFGLGAVTYCFISRRLFGFSTLYIFASVALLLNVVACLLWFFPASLLPSRPGLRSAGDIKTEAVAPDINDILQAIKQKETTGDFANGTAAGFERASQNATGEQRLVLEAGAAYMRRLQQAEDPYKQALRVLMTAETLRPDHNDKREKIAQNRELLQTFVKTTQVFSNFLENAEDNYREELQLRQLSLESIKLACQEFELSAAGILLQKQKLGTQVHVGTLQLAIVDLMEQQLGSWKEERKTGLLIFSDPGARRKFKEFQTELDDAYFSQFEIQKKLNAMNLK